MTTNKKAPRVAKTPVTAEFRRRRELELTLLAMVGEAWVSGYMAGMEKKPAGKGSK